MRLKLFDYVVLLHPETDKDGKIIGKSEIVRQPAYVLAKDEQQVAILAARDIPEEHLGHLDRVEIIVRPF